MKKYFFLAILYTSFSFGQNIGDYRSVMSGNWNALSSWEYYNGTQWTTPTATEGYPGQFNNTQIALIQQGHTITIGNTGITTQPFKQLTINGSLLLSGGTNKEIFFTIKAHSIVVTPNLTPAANIKFTNKGILQLPADGGLQVTVGGLTGDCSNNQSIYIGDYAYSVCVGGNAGSSFDEIMNAGGTLNTIPSANSPVFVGETIFLTGNYIGPPGDNLSFEWTITDPQNNVTTTTNKNTSVPNAIEGVYTAKLTCYTTYSGISYSNYETITIDVNLGYAINGPVATPGTGATCDEIIANWEQSVGAIKYYLDVATDIDFNNFVSGYKSLDVGNTLSKSITGLTNATTYYYRVYANNGTITSPRSNTISYATQTTPNGLIATVTAQPTCTNTTGTVTLNSPYLQDTRYEYNADNGPYQSSTIFTQLTSGNHYFTIRFLGEDSCTSTPAIAVINSPLEIPVANAGSDFIKTCNSNPSGKQIGTEPATGVTYSWSPTIGLSDPTIANPIANPTTTTTYTLTATQTAGGCTATDTVTATVTIDLPNASAGNDFTKTCSSFPQGKKIGSNSEVGISYNWSPSIGLSDNTISNPIANPTTTTTYTLNATNAITGCTVSDTILVTVDTTKPIADAGVGFTKTCVQNQNGKIIGGQAMPDTFYLWSPETGLSFTDGANPIANPTITTTYTLKTTNATNGCTSTDTTVVIVDYTTPTANAGTPFTKTCTQFPSGKEIGSQAEPMTTYSWSPAIGLSSTTISNPIANPSTTTTYSLTATNNSTGCMASNTVEVTVYATQPVANAGADFTKSCIDNTAGKSIGANSLPLTSYNWTPSIGLSNAKISNPIANPTETTTYTLTTTSSDSNCTATDQILVTVNTLLPEANAGSDFIKTCTLNPTGSSIGDSETAGLVYNWSPTTGLSDSTVSNPTANPTVTTVYSLITTKTSNGCINSDTVLVTVNTSVPIANAGADFIKTCTSNQSGKIIGTSPVNGNIYNWTPSSGLSSSSISNPVANPTSTTIYTLTVINSVNGCSATDTVTVTVNTSTPIANAGIDFSKTCTENPTGARIGVAPEAGINYSWSPTEGLSDASLSNPTANPTTSTTYTLITSNTTNGCSNSDTVLVTVNTAPPIADAGADFSKTCTTNSSGKKIGALPILGNTYSWSPTTGLSDANISNPIANPTVTTTYTVTVTAANGCLASDSIIGTVTIDYPNSKVAGVDQTVNCTIPSVSIGTTPETSTIYSWSPATALSSTTISNPIANPIATTTYTVIATNTASGCNTIDSVIVTADKELPIVNAGTDFTKTCTANSSGSTIGTAAITGTTYHWSPSTGLSNSTISNPIANPSATTTYTLTATGTNGCFATDQVIVTVNATYPNPNAGIDQLVNCAIPSVNIGTTAETGTTYSWTPTTGLSDTSSATPIASPTITTIYTVTATNTISGCASTDSAMIVVDKTLPLAPIPETPAQPNCDIATGSVVLSGLPIGNWILTIYKNGSLNSTISGFGNTTSVNGLTAATYNFTITNTSGCISLPSENVLINPQPSIPSAPVIGTITDPTCAIGGSVILGELPSTGTWTLHQGGTSSAQISGSGISTTISELLPGTYQYMVVSDAGCISSVSQNVIMTNPSNGIDPKIDTITHPNCSTPTGTITIINLPTNGPSITQTGPLPTTTTVIYNVPVGDSIFKTPDLSSGTYNFKIGGADLCTTANGNITINAQPPTPLAPTINITSNPSCGVSETTILISNLPSGNWIIQVFNSSTLIKTITGTGITYSATGIFTPGNYTATVTNEQGCVSPSSTIFTIIAQPLPLATPSITTTTQPICGTPTGSVVINNLPASGTWTLTQSGTSTASYSGSGTSFLVSPLTEGHYNFTVSGITGTCTSEISATVSIDQPKIVPSPPIIGTVAQPTCDSNTGSVALSGLPIGNWTLYASPSIAGGTGLSSSGTTIFLTGIPSGTYTTTVTNEDGCTSLPSADIVMNTQPLPLATPTIGTITQPICETPTGSVVINDLPATGIWTLNQSGTSSATYSGSGISYTIPILTEGSYNFTVSGITGACTSGVSLTVFIDKPKIIPNPPTIETVTQPTCDSNTGSVSVSDLPKNSWTLYSSPSIGDGLGLSGQGTTTFFAEIPTGTYFLTVKNSDGCISAPSTNLTINTQPLPLATPTIGITKQPTCETPTGSVVINGLPASETWILNQSGTSVATYSGSGISYTVPTLSEGYYNYTVSGISGTCMSGISTTVTITKSKVIPNTPIIVSITQPTCISAIGSIELNELPIDSWTLYSTPTIGDGLGLMGSGTTAILTGAAVGNYTVKVKNLDDCFSPSSLPFTLTPQPVTPLTPVVSIISQPTCTVDTGSFIITNYDSNNIYTVNPNDGVTISENTITAPNGNYTVTATLGDCTSNPSPIVKITKQPATPNAPVIVNVTQPSCESNIGSIELSSLPVGPWTLFASPIIADGSGLSGSGNSAILTGVLVGTYTVTVKNSEGCISSSSLPFTLTSQPPTPATPTVSIPIQPSCTVATGSFIITNYSSNYIYKITPETGVTLTENTITAPKGNYTVTATLGNCISEASSFVEITEQPKTPAAPIIGNLTQPSCDSKTGSIEVSGLPADSWILYSSPEIIAGGPGLPGIGTTTFFNSIPPNTYVINVKNSDGCISSYSPAFTINEQPITPVKPLLSSAIQPTCEDKTGSFRIINYDSNNIYTVIPNSGVGISGDTISAATGNYTVLAALGSCTSDISDPITINPQPVPPTPPIIDFITQSTCESNLGSISLSGLPQESWILTSSGGRTLAGAGTTAILTGNSVPGIYNVTVTNADACTSLPSADIVLHPQPTAPNAPTIETIVQPSCTIDTGTIVISTPQQGTGYEYNIDGGTYQASAIFSNVNTGIHNLTCRSVAIGSCHSEATIVEIKAPLLVNAPTIKLITQPSCTTKGSILLEGLPNGNWKLYQTGTTTETITGYGTSTTISGLEVGTYSYRVFDGTCLSKTTPNILLKPLQSTAWTGTKWTNDLPNIDKYVYMNGNYTFAVDTEMCSCQVITGLISTTEGTTITIADKLEILKGSNFIFANTSSLIQKNEVLNIGNINYNRFSAPVFLSDYTYWSSPVASQRLIEASPDTPPNKFLSFDADTNNWNEEIPSSYMKISKGYSIGSPNGFYDQNIYSYPIYFIGVPNNGTITTQSIQEGKSYLIGNPYPSAVNADQFLDRNKTVLNGTIYFWSHNPWNTTLRDASNDYASYNTTGGVGIGPKDPVTNINNTIPLGFIAAGQSFFVQGKNGVTKGIASFDNTMRIGSNNTQFFKFNTKTKLYGTIEKNRIWLDVYNNNGAFKQTLIGYITGATNDFDSAFDGTVFNGNKYIDFYSMNQDKNLTIQGRALPFDENDVVPLGFNTTIEGIFEINIEQTDGILANHDVYLEDKETAVFHNLKNGPYRFNTLKGVFDSRFVLHYKNEIPSQNKLDHPVIVSVKDGVIKVNSFFEVIDKLEIFDISGRYIYKKENVNINEYYIRDFNSSDQPLIVKTFLKNKDIVGTKIIYTSYSN